MTTYILKTLADDEYFFTDEITDEMIKDNECELLDIIAVETLEEFSGGEWKKIKEYID